MYKRIIALILVLLLAVSAVSVSAAQSDPTFAVDSVQTEAGKTVDVAIRVENNPGIASIKLKVEYANALTLQKVTYNSNIGGMSMQPQQLSSPVTVNWFNGIADTVGDWTFVTMSFAVAEDTPVGAYPVTVSYQADDVYNIAENNVYFAVANGEVTVQKAPEYLLGDVDSSQKVNIFDVTKLIYYINGRTSLTDIQKLAADMDGNEKINIFDVMKLIYMINRNA